jgi:hypothetical protein
LVTAGSTPYFLALRRAGAFVLALAVLLVAVVFLIAVAFFGVSFLAADAFFVAPGLCAAVARFAVLPAVFLLAGEAPP